MDDLLALMRLSVLQMTRGRKLLVLIALLGGAALLAAVVRNGADVPPAGWAVVSVLMLTFIFLQTLVILIPLLFATSLLRDEIEEGTLVYLFTRPIPKWKVLLAKYAATTGVCALLVVLGIGVFQLAFVIPGGADGFAWGKRTFAFMAAGALGVVGYGALFTLIGLISKRGLIVGIAYGFISEFLLTNLPAVIKKLTVMHYLRSVALYDIGLPDADMERFLGLLDLAEPGTAVGVVLAGTVVLLFLSCVLVTRNEFLTLRGAEAE